MKFLSLTYLFANVIVPPRHYISNEQRNLKYIICFW